MACTHLQSEPGVSSQVSKSQQGSSHWSSVPQSQVSFASLMRFPQIESTMAETKSEHYFRSTPKSEGGKRRVKAAKEEMKESGAHVGSKLRQTRLSHRAP